VDWPTQVVGRVGRRLGRSAGARYFWWPQVEAELQRLGLPDRRRTPAKPALPRKAGHDQHRPDRHRFPGLDDETAYELASQVVRDLAARYPDAHMASYIGTPHMED